MRPPSFCIVRYVFPSRRLCGAPPEKALRAAIKSERPLSAARSARLISALPGVEINCFS